MGYIGENRLRDLLILIKNKFLTVDSTLDDISDVNISTPTDNQVLTYNSTSSKWENKDNSGGSGSGHIIKNAQGTSLEQRSILQFSGDLETSDNSTDEKTVVVPHELTNLELSEIITGPIINPPSGYIPSTGYTPVGTIISFMGLTAPRYYLACDGTEYSIVQYPVLAKFFKDQFGSENYFGGDGETTFAVPDLRGEFLRGTGTNSHVNSVTGVTEGNGGDVGEHQNATNHLSFCVTSNRNAIYIGSSTSTATHLTSIDKDTTGGSNVSYRTSASASAPTTTTSNDLFTSRPTNTSVLYCIAYQNIYIDAKCNYSTDEAIVGTWTNGKPVYQKVFHDVNIPFTWQQQYLTRGEMNNPIANLEMIITSYGIMHNSSGYVETVPVGITYNTSANVLSMISIESNTLNTLILQYTKTTD